MDLLLENNNQILRKLSRIELYLEGRNELELDIGKTLKDQINNAIQVIVFIDKTNQSADEILAAKEDCIQRIEMFERRVERTDRKCESIQTFIYLYKKLLLGKIKEVDYSKG